MPTATDPLRRRIEAILSRSWYRTVDDEGRRAKEIDEARAAAELAALVGPLVAACELALQSLGEGYRSVGDGEERLVCPACGAGDWCRPLTHKPDCPTLIIRAALAAIDEPNAFPSPPAG